MALRTVYFIPYVLSAAVIGKVFTAYYNPFYGINQFFGQIGLTGLAETLWLGNPKIALYSVAFVDLWHWWGFVMIMFLGALQQVGPLSLRVSKGGWGQCIPGNMVYYGTGY